jgi:hypothetical protein
MANSNQFGIRKVVDGKIYDTETATEVATHDNGLGRNDFTFEWLGIFRTKGGAWFLSGETGAIGRFREQIGDGYASGKVLEVLTEQGALALLERWNETSAIEKYFPFVEEA